MQLVIYIKILLVVIGYHVTTIKSIKIGTIPFTRYYDGDNEGKCIYYFGIGDNLVSVDLFRFCKLCIY